MLTFYSRFITFLILIISVVLHPLQASNTEDKSTIKGFNLACEHYETLEENLKTIQDIFYHTEDLIIKMPLKSYNNQQKIDIMNHLGGLQAAQVSIDHRRSFLDMNNQSTDTHKQTFVMTFIAMSVVIKQQCRPTIPFVIRYNILSQEKQDLLLNAFKTIESISTKIYQYLYENTPEKSSHHSTKSLSTLSLKAAEKNILNRKRKTLSLPKNKVQKQQKKKYKNNEKQTKTLINSFHA